MPQPPGQECYSVCVPFDECGPDHHEEWVCEAVAYDESLCLEPEGCPLPPEECFPICVPNEDFCGPDGVVIEVCDEWGCWQECSWEQCPPGSFPELICDEWGCFETCVGYEEPGEPPPEPQP